MNIIVQKYNESSISNKSKLKKVCNNIIKEYNNNNKIIVIIPAQKKLINNLTNLANKYVTKKSSREFDMLISTSQTQITSILSMMLNEKGYKSINLNGEQAGIISDSNFGNCNIKSIYIENITNYLNNNYIVILPYSQAIDRLGNITIINPKNNLIAEKIISSLNIEKYETYT